MQRINMQDTVHPDRERRPLIDVLFGLNYSAGSTPTGPVTEKLASYTVLPSEYGKAFSSGAAITFTLPTPFAGAVLWIFKTSNHTITVTAEAASTVNGAASLANSTAGDAGNGALMLVGTSATTWFAFKLGTWA